MNGLNYLPGPERDLPNDPPTVTSNVRLVSQPRQWQYICKQFLTVITILNAFFIVT